MEKIVVDTYILQQNKEELLLSFLRVNNASFLRDCEDILFKVKRKNLYLFLVSENKKKMIEFKNLKSESIRKIAGTLSLKFLEVHETKPFHYIGIKAA